jgi:thiamine pyrophosphate-dependent acetolactate synthase large subunit-like protein
MGRLVADIIVETLQNAGVKHCYGVVGDTLNLIARSLGALYSTRAIMHGRGGDVWEMVKENFV